MRLLFLLPLFTACAPETGVTPTATDPGLSDSPPVDTAPDTADTGAQDTDTDLPGEYIYDEDTAAALLGPDEVAAAVEEAVTAVFSDVDPFLVLAAVDAAVSFEDEGCPTYYDEYYTLYGYEYWYGGCETDDGSAFTGYLYGIHYEPFWSYGYYYYPDYGWWYGDMAIDRADGQSYELSGYWSMYRWEVMQPAQTYVYVYAYGEPRWEGGTYGDTWLGQGASLSYTLTGGFDPQLGSWLSVDGGLSGLDGAANSVWFDGVYMATAGQGSSCDLEPSGTISIRDAAGDWYDVEFQGPAYVGASSFPPECDGCGDIWYQGQNIGQACPDTSRLVDWEGSPW